MTKKGLPCKKKTTASDGLCNIHFAESAESAESSAAVVDSCPICLMGVNNGFTVDCCKKVFCKRCIDAWHRRNPTCPMCRAGGVIVPTRSSQIGGRTVALHTRIVANISLLFDVIGDGSMDTEMVNSLIRDIMNNLHDLTI
jgi:hypothetical protein